MVRGDNSSGEPLNKRLYIYIYIYTVEIVGILCFIFRRLVSRPQLGLFNTAFIPELSSGARLGHFTSDIAKLLKMSEPGAGQKPKNNNRDNQS